MVKEHFELQKSDKLKENVQAELNRKNQLILANHELVHQQDAGKTYTHRCLFICLPIYLCAIYVDVCAHMSV